MDTPSATLSSSTRQRHSHKSSSGSASPNRSTTKSPYHHPHHHHAPHPHQIAAPVTTSRWQQLVVNASSAAGTTAAVISEESMKCLKYCLSWLQYAIRHIEQQMNVLQSYLTSMATNSQSLTVPTGQPQSKRSRSVLSGIKKDIVETLRKVVEVITRYAGTSLPTQSRQIVRGFILNLPGKWASLNDIRSTATSPATSPMLTPSRCSSISSLSSSSDEAALRLLSFGQESVDMLQSVSTVFSDTVDRAELWIDRLKMVPGISLPNNNDSPMKEDAEIKLPPIHQFMDQQHRKEEPSS